jgi:hypothetical protein
MDNNDDQKINNEEYDEEYSFINEYNRKNNQDETSSSSKDNKTTLNNDDGNIFDPNLEYVNWDFHPEESEPPTSFTYATYLESLRISVNTFIKRPLRFPFQTNSKKTII